MTVVYHRTNAAAAILASGFRGRSARFLTDASFEDVVWLSGCPDDGDQELSSGAVIVVDVSAEIDLEQFAVIEEGSPWREWAVPATLANSWPRRLLGSEWVPLDRRWARNRTAGRRPS